MTIIAPGTKHIERRLKTSSPVGLLIGLLLFTTASNAEEIVLRPDDPSALRDQQITLTGGTEPTADNPAGTPGDSLEIQAGFILQPTTRGDAVTVNGYKNVIKNAGSITTIDHLHSHGIDSRGIDATITNQADGTIKTPGAESHGINSSGANAKIFNAGLITIAGNRSHGIDSGGSDATITNQAGGTIETKDEQSYGIASSGNAVKIFNAGLIRINDKYSYGISSNAIDAVITNEKDGTIETKANYSHGIYSWRAAAKAQISNAGLITTAGEESHGIDSRGIDATITNEQGGKITTEKKSSYGIYSRVSGATITNEQGGTIETQRASGIVVGGTSNHLINRGSISALDAASYAILGTAEATVLTLKIEAGSRIIGKIDLGGSADGDTVRISDDGQTHLVIDNVEQVQFSDAIKSYAVYNTVGKTTTIRILNPATVEASRGRALSALSGTLQAVSQQRLDHSRALGLTLSSARHFQARAPLAWGQVFGSSESVDAKGKALAYELSQQGFSLGYERDYQGRRLGLLGGVAITNSESDIASFEQKTSSTYFGAYAHFNLGDFNLATALIAGIDGHDNERLLIGSNLEGAKTETAKADFSGWFLSPSVSLSSVYDLNDQLELRPSLRLGYSLASQSKYTESGSEVNLTVKSRSLNALTAQLQVAAIYHLNSGMDLTAHLGFGSSSRSEGKIETSLGTKSIPFAPLGESSESGLIAGLGLRTSLNERLNLAAGVESNADRLNYQLSLAYSF